MNSPANNGNPCSGEECKTEFTETLQILQQTASFSNAPMEALKLLAFVCRRQAYDTDETIFTQDEDDGAAYFIRTGSAALQLDKGGQTHHIRSYGPDSFIGSLCLLSPVVKPFSLVAETPASCLVLTRQAFAKVVDQFPELPGILGTAMAKRLVEADRKASQAMTTAATLDIKKIMGISLI